MALRKELKVYWKEGLGDRVDGKLEKVNVLLGVS
jgi:hypothetical protein